MSAFDDATRIRAITVEILALIAEAGGDAARVVDAMQPNANVVLDGLIVHVLITQNGDMDAVRARFVRHAQETQGDERA